MTKFYKILGEKYTNVVETNLQFILHYVFFTNDTFICICVEKLREKLLCLLLYIHVFASKCTEYYHRTIGTYMVDNTKTRTRRLDREEGF